MDCSERGNPLAKKKKKIFEENIVGDGGSNQRPPVLKSSMLSTDLRWLGNRFIRDCSPVLEFSLYVKGQKSYLESPLSLSQKFEYN